MHIASLHQDYFTFDATSHQLHGERTGVRYRLGDAVRVKVVRVNLDDKKIDFELIQAAKKSTKTAGKAEAGGKTAKSKAKPKTKGAEQATAKPKPRRRRKS